MLHRVGIVALLHESNTFIHESTSIDHFRSDVLLFGRDVQEYFTGSKHEIGGFLEELLRLGIEPVPLFAARAIPFGPIDASSFAQLVEMMLEQVCEAGPLDGILAAPHGATVAEGTPDADGFWLTKLRETVGPKLPLIATFDAHANVSSQMVAATDALVGYRTNPHVDQFERGCEAAKLMHGVLTTGRGLVQRHAMPPVAINIQHQNTSELPLAEIWHQADRLREREGIASISMVLGFPYADVPEMGSSAIVVAYQDTPDEMVEEALNQLERTLVENRTRYEPEFVSPEAAVRMASESEGTTCLLDMGDNIGGGAPGDSTVLAAQLHRQRIGPALVCLYDPNSVKQCAAASPGDTLSLALGGVSGSASEPLLAEVEFIQRADGVYHESQVRHGGWSQFDQGATAIVRTVDSQLTIMINSRRTPPFSLSQLTHYGLDPKSYRAIVAKGVIAPMAAYAPVVDRFIHVNTPGCTCADMRSMTYHNRRQPLFPFEKIDA